MHRGEISRSPKETSLVTLKFMNRKTKARPKNHQQIPARFQQFGKKYPAIMRAYEALGAATQEAMFVFVARRNAGRATGWIAPSRPARKNFSKAVEACARAS